jgi:hypothetical protein
MTILSETNHAGGFLCGELPNNMSRKAGTLITGQDLLAGAVLGKISKVQAAAPIPAIVGTGTGAMTALTFGTKVQTGSYVITLLATSATAAFSVVAPDGTALANGAVGTAYKSDHLNFLVSSAGTMTVGDSYTVVVTAAGTPVVIGGTGTGVMSAISLGPDAQNGGYRVINRAVVAEGGDFEVLAPDGSSIGRFLMGTTSTGTASFASRHINFTLSDATDYILGNYFNVIVAAGSGKYTALAPTAVDGSQDAAAILFADTDATSADKPCVVIDNNAVVNADELVWPTLGTAGKASATSQLNSHGIVLR